MWRHRLPISNLWIILYNYLLLILCKLVIVLTTGTTWLCAIFWRVLGEGCEGKTPIGLTSHINKGLRITHNLFYKYNNVGLRILIFLQIFHDIFQFYIPLYRLVVEYFNKLIVWFLNEVQTASDSGRRSAPQ